jgi:hypothetical protein
MSSTSTITAAEPVTRVALEVHICDQRRSYTARFDSGDLAVAFMRRKVDEAHTAGYAYGNYSINEMEDQPVAPVIGPVTPDVLRLLAELYPTCEHGMSLELCSGPEHFLSAEQERAMGW